MHFIRTEKNLINEYSAVSHLCEAVRIPTVSCEEEGDMAPFLQFHAWLRETYPRLHRAMEQETVDQYALLYRWPGQNPCQDPILLLAHMDVVPPGDGPSWRFPPFSGTVAEGMVWGRGALDMKGHLVAICEAVEALLRGGFIPKRDVYLCFGYDEELMRESSAAKVFRLLQERGLRFAMILDEGVAVNLAPLGVTGDVIALCAAEKGYADIRLTAAGQAGHASAPPTRTAIGTLARAIAALEDCPMPLCEGGIAGTILAAIDPLLPPGADCGALFQGDAKLRALTRTTIAPTMLMGAPMSNVLPHAASCVFNVRIAPMDTLDGVLAHMQALCPGLTAEVLLYNPPVPAADISGAAFSILAACAKKAFPGAQILPYVMTAATDSRYFSEICSNILRLTPFRHGDAGLMHGVNERLPIADYLEAIDFFRLLLEQTPFFSS